MTDPTEKVATRPSLLSYGWKKEMVLIRGLPGSGKSTLGEKIVGKSYVKGVTHYEPRQVVEADEFFMVNAKYQWTGALCELAHQWCLAECFRRFLWHDRIAVANTFIKRWQLLPYIEQARKFQVRVWLLEPEGNRLPQVELARRNVHGVPVERIEQMMLEWEEMTQEEVEILLGLPSEMRGQQIVIPEPQGMGV